MGSAHTHQRSGSYTPFISLAKGGMGEIELALKREGEFSRIYAVKRLKPAFRDDPEVRRMFLEEARIAGLINHPNVVSVLDVGEDERGSYLVMEYVEGVSAVQLLRRVQSLGEMLPVQLVLRIIADVARGLHAAHELVCHDGTPHPVVHRDVSPQNILIGFDGVTRVTDFGVAKVLNHISQTVGDVLKGKYGYMSPEQLSFKSVDHRSDLFSLGIVLFELVVGERLYRNEGEVLAARRILEEPPPDMGEERSDLPAELVALSFELLSKDPDLRPPNAAVVAERLDNARVALEAEESVGHIDRFIAACFGEERQHRKQMIGEALDALESTGTMGSLVDEQEPTTQLLPTARSRRRTSARRPLALLWFALTFCCAALLGGALVLWLTRSEPASTETNAVTAPGEEPPLIKQAESTLSNSTGEAQKQQEHKRIDDIDRQDGTGESTPPANTEKSNDASRLTHRPRWRRSGGKRSPPSANDTSKGFRIRDWEE